MYFYFIYLINIDGYGSAKLKINLTSMIHPYPHVDQVVKFVSGLTWIKDVTLTGENAIKNIWFHEILSWLYTSFELWLQYINYNEYGCINIRLI